MKRILAMALSVMLVATLAISGTVAYFTDDESKVNTMTVGSVNIKLHEDQRPLNDQNDPTPNSEYLDPFENDKNMMPVVENGGNDTKWGMSVDKNYIDKIVRVENTGDSDAFVRIFIAIPAALETTYLITDESGNPVNVPPLHWDTGKDFTSADETEEAKRAAFNEYFANNGYVQLNGTTKIDGIEYNIYCFTSTKPLPASNDAKDMTGAAMVGFYLDSHVDYDDKTNQFYMGKKGEEASLIKFDLTQKVNIPVYVQAVQADGFINDALSNMGADAAFQAAGMPTNPWAAGNTMFPDTTEDDPTAVSTVAALLAALAEGGEIELAQDLNLSASNLTMAPASSEKSYNVGLFIKEDTVLDLNGHNITFDEGNNATAGIFVHGADLTIIGEGTVKSPNGSSYLIWARGDSTVDIKGGTFVGLADDSSVLYADGYNYDTTKPWATINVYGGSFTSGNPTDWQDCANVMNHGVGRINYYGGTFNWNPDHTDTTYPWANESPERVDDKAYIQVATGKTVVNNGNGTWTVQ